MKRLLGSLLFSLLACLACGAPAKPAPSTATTSEIATAEETDAGTASPASSGPGAASTGVPLSCASQDGNVCLPEAGFVKRVCNGSFPDVALLLFGKETPFTRVYLRSEIDGWNAEGGASARAKLFFDEEVLALRRREAPKNGIVVGSGGGWLVMRWDGNCYTVEDNEVTTKKPPSPKHAAIPFRFYGERTKNALLESDKVLAAYKRRGKECKGATSGEVTKGCEQADVALSAAIVGEVRGGKTIPLPEKLP
jgi:hypothetical protein